MIKRIQYKHKLLATILASSAAVLFLFQNMTPLRTPLLTDLNYSNGFYARDPRNSKVYLFDTQGNPVYGFINGKQCHLYKMVPTNPEGSYSLYFNNLQHSNDQAWSLGQWDSRPVLPQDFIGTDPSVSEWINQNKKLSIGKLGSGKRGLILGVNGEMEYNGSWDTTEKHICEERLHPAVLATQKATILPFGQYQKLMLRFKSKILKDELKPQYLSGWDRLSSTSHVKIHVNIQNIRADKNVALGHGQSFGLSINFYDVRNTDTVYAMGHFIHRPQRRYMLRMGPDDLLPGTRAKLHSKMWVDLQDVDLMPFVKKAFANAISFGDTTNSYVDKIIDRNLANYSVSSINFGWEVSTLHNVELHVSDINLEAER